MRAAAVGAVLLVGTPALAPAVVSARDLGADPTPRVRAVVRQGLDPGFLAVLPLQDAPASPGTGSWATAVLERLLEARGVGVVLAEPPPDAGERPTPPTALTVGDLAALAAEAGASAALSGRLTEIHQEELDRPGAVVHRRGLEVYASPEVAEKVTVGAALRLATAEGRLACSASGTLGPVRDLSPDAALEILFEAILDRCFVSER